MINWNNEKGVKKTISINDREIEKVDTKNLLQKNSKSSSFPYSSGTVKCDSIAIIGCSSGGGCGSNFCPQGSISPCFIPTGENGLNCNIGNNYGNSYLGYGYGNGYDSGAYGGRAGEISLNGYGDNNLVGDLNYGRNPNLGIGAFYRNGNYDRANCLNTNNLRYDQLCNLLNKERASNINKNNARCYLRGNKEDHNNIKNDYGFQIDKICKENERSCFNDACNSAKISNGDIRTDKCFSDKINNNSNGFKKTNDIINLANRKNGCLNMNEKARDNLHSHKRIVCEFDKLEHFKKCCENCKDAEKGKRCNVKKANNINNNLKNKIDMKTNNSTYCDNNNQCNSRDDNEFNYCNGNNNNYNRNNITNNHYSDSDNNLTDEDYNCGAYCNSDERTNSNSFEDGSCEKYGKKDINIDRDFNCVDKNHRDTVENSNCLRKNRNEYPYYPHPLGREYGENGNYEYGYGGECDGNDCIEDYGDNYDG